MKTSATAADVVIVGGGLIGLSIAWHLLRTDKHLRVTVLDRFPVQEVGTSGQPSYAAAGMLAPLAEASTPGPFVRLGLESLARYPAFVAEITEASGGINPNLSGPGMLRVAFTPDEWNALQTTAAWQRATGNPLPLCELTGDAVRTLEPAVSPRVCGALLSPEEKQVEPRLLLQALRTACCQQPSFTLRAGVTVTDFVAGRTRLCAVQLETGEQMAAGSVVVAGGAWSAALGQKLRTVLPLTPVRGQILALRPQAGVLTRHTMFHGGCGYVVPRVDGRVIVGATEEPTAGWDSRLTAQGLSDVLQRGISLLPALADATFDSAWVGMRPATPDHLPILGPLPGWENAWAATGHFRNGILLAPITGHLIAEGLRCSGSSDARLAFFTPARFQEG